MASLDATPGPANSRTAGSVPSQDPSQAWARRFLKRNIPQPPKRVGKAAWFCWEAVVSLAVKTRSKGACVAASAPAAREAVASGESARNKCKSRGKAHKRRSPAPPCTRLQCRSASSVASTTLSAKAR